MNPTNSSNPSAPAGESYPGGVTESSGTLTETKNKITQTAREATYKAKEAASDTVTRAREQASRLAAEKKETAVNRIQGYSSAIHETARSLEEKDPNIAWFTHRTADKLQSVADYMRNRDFTALRRDAEDMARRHPAMFFGGLFFAGLVVGNLVKASRRDLEDADEDEGERTNWSESQPESGLYRPDLTEAERSAAGI